MSLDDLKRLDREVLTPTQVADLLNCSAHGVRSWARQRPEQLGFPVCIIGTRVRIPKRPFIQFMEGKA